MIEFHELCAKCSVRKGTHRWSGEMDNINAMRHFNSLPLWCERCVVREQLAYAKDQASKIPEYEAKLKSLEETQRPDQPPPTTVPSSGVPRQDKGRK